MFTRTAKHVRRLLSALVLVMMAAACGPPPKVLIDAQYLGEARTAKMLMRRSAEGQFDQFLRICSLHADGRETDCKDTLVLKNVVPGTLY